MNPNKVSKHPNKVSIHNKMTKNSTTPIKNIPFARSPVKKLWKSPEKNNNDKANRVFTIGAEEGVAIAFAIKCKSDAAAFIWPIKTYLEDHKSECEELGVVEIAQRRNVNGTNTPMSSGGYDCYCFLHIFATIDENNGAGRKEWATKLVKFMNSQGKNFSYPTSFKYCGDLTNEANKKKLQILCWMILFVILWHPFTKMQNQGQSFLIMQTSWPTFLEKEKWSMGRT